MRAEQSFRDGDLAKAIKELEQAIRDDPANSDYRVFLFQLLADEQQIPGFYPVHIQPCHLPGKLIPT